MFKDLFNVYSLVIILVLVVLYFIIESIVHRILKSPFQYPYFNCTFDVSGERSPNLERHIEEYINKGGFGEIVKHHNYVIQWKNECEEKLSKCKLKKLRRKQYEACLNDKNAYRFFLSRNQKQNTYYHRTKRTYQVHQNVESLNCNYEWLLQKYNELKAIGFEATLQDYHAREQRRLMTKQLRQEIAARDNYTCRYCGKYMPDGVGLQIDHIIPVAKGGKSIPSNLQVLCSKCNGAKSSKIV